MIYFKKKKEEEEEKKKKKKKKVLRSYVCGLYIGIKVCELAFESKSLISLKERVASFIFMDFVFPYISFISYSH